MEDKIDDTVKKVAQDITAKTLKVKSYLCKIASEPNVQFIPNDITEKDIFNLFGKVKIDGTEIEYGEINNGGEEAGQGKLLNIKLEGDGSVDLMSCENCKEGEIFISNRPKQISMIDSSGRIAWCLTLDLSPESITFNSDNYLLMSFFKYQQIQCSRQLDGSVKSYISTAPLFPLGIYCETSGIILACLVESFNFTTTKKSRRLVRRYSEQGTVLNDIETVYGKRLFSCPYRVCGGFADRVHVLDITSSDTGRVIVTTDTGFVVFEFNGEINSEKFCPADLCVDNNGHLYVIQSQLNCLYILNPSGVILQKTSPFVLKKAISITLAWKEMIAVGFDNNSVEFLERTSDKNNSDKTLEPDEKTTTF